MTPEATELVRILFYLLLTLAGGAMVAVLAIFLIILMITLGVWLALQITSFKKRSNQFG